MKKVKDLLVLDGRVYIRLASKEECERFLQMAEDEGFLFCDGKKPTQKERDSVYALNKDMTMNYVGYIGHMTFNSKQQEITIDGQRLIRLDFADFFTD